MKKETSVRSRLVSFFLRFALNCLCKIDSREIVLLDGKAPAILAVNHINFLEVPILQTQIEPRPMRGLVKAETWKNPVMRFLFNTYRAIPVSRDALDLGAFRETRRSLEEGFFICIAPEGTRSGNGVLAPGKAGIVHLALTTGMPVIPVAHYGGEKIWQNIKRLRRTEFTIRVGRPFYYKTPEKPSRTIREKMLAETMFQLAGLLPEPLRGAYVSIPAGPPEYLDFREGEGKTP